MATMHRPGATLPQSVSTESEIDLLTQRIANMSSPELLRFGLRTKLKCAQSRHAGRAQRAALALQLQEAQTEWKRRYPDLPLSESF